jgi:hypothetical protein
LKRTAFLADGFFLVEARFFLVDFMADYRGDGWTG